MPRPPFTWEPATQRYRDAAGRFLARSEVRRALDATVDATRDGVRSLGRQLADGRIAVGEWEAQMRRLIKDSQLSAAAAARGGWAHMDAATYGRAGAAVRAQYGFLAEFAEGISRGAVVFDEGFLERMQMYVESARGTYHEVERREMRTRGFDEERSVLGAADHCEECIAQDALGWQPLGTMTPIGARTCLSHCHCAAHYRNRATGEESAR